MATAVFWLAVLLLMHTYVLYPLILLALDGLAQVRRGRRDHRGGQAEATVVNPPPPESLPSVTIVVAAYNEAAWIGRKIENCLALDYPADRLQVIVGSDGSTDATDAIVREVMDPRVLLLSAPRAGKASVLNRCIPVAQGDVVVLTDANTLLEPDALRRLVRHFQEPEVGAVCGRLRLFDPVRGEHAETTYWAYESFIKLYEGKRGVVVGANGGIYAIRRRLFSAVPPGTIVDDFVIPLRILAMGYRVLYDAEAIAHEETAGDDNREFARRTRIAAGNFQSLRLLPQLLSPTAGMRAFAFWSHKVLRWSAPALMLVALLTNLMLAGSLMYLFTLSVQVAFYALALIGRALPVSGAMHRLATASRYFVLMNVAIAVGFWRFLRKAQGPTWQPTARV